MGHEWLAIVKDIKRGHWCPECAGLKKLDIKQCDRFAKLKGGRCLSSQYTNVDTKLEWECDKKHTWWATFNHIKGAGSWCPKCANVSAHSLEFCIGMAKNNDGECLSDIYINSKTKMRWRCKNGHCWSATLFSIKNMNSWCPECRVFKAQSELARIVEILLNSRVVQNYRKFEWLRVNKIGSAMEIDIYVPELKIAIEYDGEQHFRPVRWYSGISLKEAKYNLKIQMHKDVIKNKLIYKHIKKSGQDIKYFIRFDYKENITPEYVQKKFQQLKIL